MNHTAASIPFRSLRPEVKGMPVLRLIANKAIDVLNKQRLLSLTATQFQQHVQSAHIAAKRQHYGPFSLTYEKAGPTRGLKLSAVSLCFLCLKRNECKRRYKYQEL